jgi:hypothetical protein
LVPEEADGASWGWTVIGHPIELHKNLIHGSQHRTLQHPQIRTLTGIDVDKHQLREDRPSLTDRVEHPVECLFAIVDVAGTVLGVDEVSEGAQAVRQVVQNNSEGAP